MKFSLIPVIVFVAITSQATSLKKLNDEKFPLTLPALDYSTDSLAVAIDQQTMETHHGKHHKAYVDNANAALPLEKKSVMEILKKVSTFPAGVRNNVGGHWNHSFFWKVLTPDTKNQKIPSQLKKEIETAFGSFEEFKKAFEKQGASRFGSGWVWLIRNQQNKLEITTTEYQDNPLMDTASVQGIPIFGIDVWEHAYYLKYQNKRAEYLSTLWNIVNWKQVEAFNREALSMIKSAN